MAEPLKVRFVIGGGDPVLGLSHLLDTLTRWNAALMRAHDVPPLYRSGVRYLREDYGGTHPEDWRDCAAVLAHGGGDCEDLAAYRAGELRAAGEAARCVYHVSRRPGGGRLFHIVVERHFPGSRIYEDPSRALGMGREV